LKVEEEKDLIRVEEKKYELTEFYENQFKFGTISIITKTEFPPPKDVILHLARVQKLKIGTNWHHAEIPKKSRILIEKLEINMDDT
jgi:hypothetical protein